MDCIILIQNTVGNDIQVKYFPDIHIVVISWRFPTQFEINQLFKTEIKSITLIIISIVIKILKWTNTFVEQTIK